MRLAAPLALALCFAGPAYAAPTSPQSARPQLTDQRRGELAVEAVKRSLAPWVQKGSKVTVRPAIVPFNGDPHNPITGVGPVEVFVTQEKPVKGGFIRRLLARFDPYAKQKYLVHVGTNGEANVLERLSLAPHRRFARFVANKLPLATLLVDFLKSDRAAEGMWTLAGAGGAAMVNPMLSGALLMRVGMVVHEGIKSQYSVRKLAMDGTVAWANDAHKQGGVWPTLMETYRAYRGKVEEQQTGARPLALGDFAEALSIRQL